MKLDFFQSSTKCVCVCLKQSYTMFLRVTTSLSRVPSNLLYCLFFIQIQLNLAVIPGQTLSLYLTLYLASDVPINKKCF